MAFPLRAVMVAIDIVGQMTIGDMRAWGCGGNTALYSNVVIVVDDDLRTGISNARATMTSAVSSGGCLV